MAGRFAIVLFTFLYVDIIDRTAMLYSMARFCNRIRRGDKDFPPSTVAYYTDAVCISLGAPLGCSPVTVVVESGEGNRRGRAHRAHHNCYRVVLPPVSLLRSSDGIHPPLGDGEHPCLGKHTNPLNQSRRKLLTPSFEVGCLMIRQVTRINWNYIGVAIPSFVTIAFIPFSYSVAYGLIA